MNLTAKDVAEIMRLVEESNFDEIKLETGGVKLHLRRNGAAMDAVSVDESVSSMGRATVPPVVAAVVSKAPPISPPAGSEAVAAPLLGTFYRAPKPGAAPYVEIGSEVDAETVVGIIEVMKLMNAVRAGVRGTVTAICSQDSALVEFGETLMFVKPAR